LPFAATDTPLRLADTPFFIAHCLLLMSFATLAAAAADGCHAMLFIPLFFIFIIDYAFSMPFAMPRHTPPLSPCHYFADTLSLAADIYAEAACPLHY
jgi:hypothetical protein